MIEKQKLTPIAVAVIGLGLIAPAQAGDIIEFDNGMKLDWRVNSTYTLSTRMDSRENLLAAEASNANGNDGNNNFDKGALTANRLGLLLDAKLSKGNTGFVMSASTFYDDAYHQSNDNSAATRPNKLAGPVDEFSGHTKRYHGGYSRLLDAYGYTSFDIGEQGRLNVRLGKQVVSWGESLFFPGISLAQGPADGTKTGIPGTETKDQLLPEDQLSLQYEVNPDWSLLAHVQYNWHETISPAPGSYLSTSDIVGPGAQCLKVGGACAVRRLVDDRPGKTGQWGVGTRYRVTDETEVGLYYLNYHDRVPNVDINFLSAVPTYRIRYQEDVKLIGASFSTTFGIATLGGEMSYKKGAPALVNTTLSGSPVPTATTANVLQTNLNTFINFGRTALSESTAFLAEVSYVDVSSPKARRAPGAETLPAAFVDFVAPESDKLTFGSHGLAVSATLSLSYPGIIEQWDLGVPISYSQQIQGRTLLGGVGGEGDRRASVGATMTYKRNFQVGLTYLAYLGDPSLKAQTFRGLTDRDQLSLVMKYSF